MTMAVVLLVSQRDGFSVPVDAISMSNVCQTIADAMDAESQVGTSLNQGLKVSIDISSVRERLTLSGLSAFARLVELLYTRDTYRIEKYVVDKIEGVVDKLQVIALAEFLQMTDEYVDLLPDRCTLGVLTDLSVIATIYTPDHADHLYGNDDTKIRIRTSSRLMPGASRSDGGEEPVTLYVDHKKIMFAGQQDYEGVVKAVRDKAWARFQVFRSSRAPGADRWYEEMGKFIIRNAYFMMTSDSSSISWTPEKFVDAQPELQLNARARKRMLDLLHEAITMPSAILRTIVPGYSPTEQVHLQLKRVLYASKWHDITEIYLGRPGSPVQSDDDDYE